MHFLLALFAAPVLASTIEQLGAGSPGIDAMWADIKGIFPHTEYGSGGLAFVVAKFIFIILQIAGAVAVAVLIYGGIRLITSHGNDEGLTDAKKVVMYALLGIVCILVADAVVVYVMSVLTVAVGG